MEITPWADAEPATEARVKQIVRASGREAVRWTGEAGQHWRLHHHGHQKYLWCAAGSITFHVGGRSVRLNPGDAMVLPAATEHAADAGREGVVCFESPPIHDNTTTYS